MKDSWTRRNAMGSVLAVGATAAKANDLSVAAMRRNGSTTRDDIEGSIIDIGLFSQARDIDIPRECMFVRTSGHTLPGKGSAKYVFDPTVNVAYVAEHPRTAFVTKNDRGFRLSGDIVDVDQVGALGNGTTDDTSSIQEALDFVEAGGGGIVLLPIGRYVVSSPIALPGTVGFEGYGQFSSLEIHGCNGINIRSSNTIGPRRIANMWIRGHGCENFSAIVSDLLPPLRAQGLVFENIYIAFFGTAARCRGLWHTTFRNLTINQVWTGIYLFGQNVKITVDNCHITHGGLLSGKDYSQGIIVGDAAFDLRPEDVQISKSLIYGFSKAIVWRTALFGAVSNCDLDACTKTGIELVTADGGFSFRDNWIQVGSEIEDTYGIHATALGYIPELSNVSVQNNRINSLKSGKSSSGIFADSNQSNLEIIGNSFFGEWKNSIYIRKAKSVAINGNRSKHSLIVESSRSISIEKNYFDNGITLSNNSSIYCSENFGKESPKITGTVVFPAGQKSLEKSFADLGLPNLPNGSYDKFFMVGDNGSGISYRLIADRFKLTLIATSSSPTESKVSFVIEVR